MAVSLSFHLLLTVLWNADEDILMKDGKTTMERPGIVGPMDEILVTDEDPVSEKIVYRIDNGTSSEGGVDRGVKVRRRSCLEAASKIHILAKEHIVAFCDFQHVKMSMRHPGTIMQAPI